MCDYTSVEVDREEYRGLCLKIGLHKRSTTLGIQNFRDSAHTLGSFRWQCYDRDKRIFLDRLLDRFAKQDLFADSFFEIGDICCDLGMGNGSGKCSSYSSPNWMAMVHLVWRSSKQEWCLRALIFYFKPDTIPYCGGKSQRQWNQLQATSQFVTGDVWILFMHDTIHYSLDIQRSQSD